jgi:hypothetical protein
VLGNDAGTRYEFMPLDPFHVSEGVMEYLSTSIFPDMLCDDRSFYDVVTSMLREGFGMTCWMNERFIPNRRAYQQYDFVHDNMVVGYDDDKRALVVLGYSPAGQYVSTLVPLEQIVSSLANDSYSAVSLNFVRPNSCFQPTFHFDNVVKQISCYLESTSIGALGYSEFYGIKHWITGIEATQRLGCTKIDEIGFYDIRLYSFLKDRVTLMYNRAKYMMDKGYIRYCGSLLSELLRIVTLANNTHFLAMKYNLQNYPSHAESIQHNIEQIVEVERAVLPRIICN